MVNIYSDTLETRIERIQSALCGRDYEGTITLLTSDVTEIMEYLNKIEKLKETLKE